MEEKKITPGTDGNIYIPYENVPAKSLLFISQETCLQTALRRSTAGSQAS